MLALWLCHLPVRKAYRSIYRLNDVTPEISLTVISSKEKKREGRQEEIRGDKKWQNVETVYLSKVAY